MYNDKSRTLERLRDFVRSGLDWAEAGPVCLTSSGGQQKYIRVCEKPRSIGRSVVGLDSIENCSDTSYLRVAGIEEIFGDHWRRCRGS